MRAEIISIGTELLLGEITDTNTTFLANQLSSLGIDLYFTSSVGDNGERLLAVLRQAWRRSDLILTTGGLGPTQDDITREAIAELFGEKLEVDPKLEQTIINYFTCRGVEMPASNNRQATVIPSAVAIPNSKGTAPGWWLEKSGRIIITMPGPPDEMHFMWQNEVLPRLRQRTSAVILSRTIKTFGLPESTVEEMISPFVSLSNPTVATNAKLDGIHLRITAKADQTEAAKEMISTREADIRAILDEYIWGVDEETLEDIAGHMLFENDLSLAICECFTGGFLGNTLANSPSCRDCFYGGIYLNSDEAKFNLGITSSSVGEADIVRSAKAAGLLARQKFKADIGIGIDGYTELINDIEMDRIVIFIKGKSVTQPVVSCYSGRHGQMKKRAAYCALFDLIRLVSGRL